MTEFNQMKIFLTVFRQKFESAWSVLLTDKSILLVQTKSAAYGYVKEMWLRKYICNIFNTDITCIIVIRICLQNSIYLLF